VKLQKVLLRWYKSFHLNYRQVHDRGETEAFRPWNTFNPSYAGNSDFPFIEIPIESDITTIVGGNESGKSHLLDAINKVMKGNGIQSGSQFARTDLCHYAGIREINVKAWPNIGLQFTVNSTELKSIGDAIGTELSVTPNSEAKATFALILAPDGDNVAVAYFSPNPAPILLKDAQLTAVRKCLPRTQFINSAALLPSEIPLADLIRGYDPSFQSLGLRDRERVEQAAAAIIGLSAPSQPDLAAFNTQLVSIQQQLNALSGKKPSEDSLEMLLFRQILEVDVETLKYIYGLDGTNRGYVEGQIAKWNEALNDRLNLSHFWHQDDQFNLVLNYKDGVLYFEIHDKTECIYTFGERSSGLKYFLSYYIQAKAMEMSGRSRNSIVLMDEPDAALSILAQRNLLSVFESLVRPESSSQTCQLIYTTHSPYLINRNFPRRITVVKKEDAEEGTQYIEQARARRYEPVRSALGIDSAPSLFLGADNVILEGATDQYLLTELIRIFATPENVGDFLDLNSVVIVSADGVGSITSLLEQSTWADEPIPACAVLLDSDDAAKTEILRIVRPEKPSTQLLPRESIGQLADLVKPFGSNTAIVTTEDIVPVEMYKRAIRSYIERWLPSLIQSKGARLNEALESADFGQNGIAESTKSLFAEVQPELKGDFDKMGIFQEVIEELGSYSQKLEQADFQALHQNVNAICCFMNESLADSRARTTQYAATRSIKRLIKDFARLNKDKVPITNVLKLFRRLDREVEPVGSDGLEFSSVMKEYIAELEKLRSAGQTILAGDDWSKWDSKISVFKKNPIAAASNSNVSKQPEVVPDTQRNTKTKSKAIKAVDTPEVRIAPETA
jgi:predicted ATPase